MINRFITFLIITVLSFTVFLAQAQPSLHNRYVIRHFNDENGLPQNSIADILSDDNGYLWLATQGGLVRYDGNSFRSYYPENKPVMESNVRFLGKGYGENIYFQTWERNLYCYACRNGHTLSKINSAASANPLLLNYHKQLFNFSRFLKVPPSAAHPPDDSSLRKRIFLYISRFDDHFFVIDSTHLYLLYNDTAYYYNGDRLLTLQPLLQRNLQYFTLDRKWYLLNNDSIVAVFENGKKLTTGGPIRGDLKTYLTSNFPAGKRPASGFRLFAGKACHLLVDNKLYRLTPDPDGMVRSQYLLDLEFAAHISGIAYNKELDILFIATLTEGFYTLQRNPFHQPAIPPAGAQELAQYMFGPLALLNGEDILTQKFIFNDKGRFDPVPDSLPARQQCLFVDKQQHVWQAVYNLPRMMSATMRPLKIFPALDAQIVDYKEDPTGNLYCLTEKSLYIRQSDSFRLLFTTQPATLASANQDPASQSQVNQNPTNPAPAGQDSSTQTNETFREIAPGHFWIGSDRGLTEYDLSTGRASIIPALAGCHIRAICQCRDGNVLIGTYGQGFYYYRRGKFYKMPLDRNGFLITAHCFLEDNKDKIWIPCNKGLFTIPKADLDAWCDTGDGQLYYYYFGRQDGLGTNEFNGGSNAAGLISSDDYITLLSMKGIVCFYADSLVPRFPANPIEMTNVEIDGKSGINGDRIKLPQGYNSLIVEISCPFLGNRNNLHLEYNLKGLNQEWKAVPEDGLLNLSRLSPGNYLLTIRKVNGFGKNNYQYREWPLVVIPQFYQTTWFKLLMTIIVILVLVLVIQLWLKLIEKRREIRLKAEKLKGTVSALRQTVAKLQESEKALLQTNKIREKLISLVIHDLRSPLRFLTMLATDLHDTQHRMTLSEIRERTYWIKKGAHDIYNFSEDFLLWVTSQKNNFSIRKQLFPIKPLLQELYDFFREQVQQKGNNISYEAEEGLHIYSDPHILITVIRNLVDNANKYTDKGNILISARGNDGGVAISVADNGKGMSPARLEAFLRNDGLDDVKSGSQLGHKFVFDLTKRIDGTVSVESTEGIGTTVSLHFPRQEQTPGL